MISFKINKTYLGYFTLYILTNLFLLTNTSGIYWDDSTLHGQQLEDLTFHFKQAGWSLWGYVHYYLNSVADGIYVYRLLTFFLLFATGLFLNHILKTITIFNTYIRIFIVIFFLIAPFYSARVALIDMLYTLCYFTFFAAFYILSKRYILQRFFVFRLITLVLFFFSFLTNSILLYYGIVLLYILYQEKRQKKTIVQTVVSHLDFLFLPILFYFFKLKYMTVETIFTGYNQITVDGLAHALIATFTSFKLTFLGYFIMPLTEIHQAYFPFDTLQEFILIFLSITVLTLLTLFYFFRDVKQEETSYRVLFFIFALGFFLFYIAAYPAYVVHKIPSPLTFNSRLELLMPLGWSFMTVSFIMLFTKTLRLPPLVNTLFFGIIASYYITFNTITMLQFMKDDFVQQSLIINFKNHEKIKNAHRLVIYDYNRYDHVYRRKFAWYEYNYLLKQAFGDETRFATDYLDKREITHFEKFIPFPTYNFTDYKPSVVDYNVYVRTGTYKLSLQNTASLTFSKLLFPKQYKDKIPNIVDIKISEYK